MVAYENFLSDEEVDVLRHEAESQQFRRTSLIGKNGFFVHGSTITSRIANMPTSHTQFLVRRRIADTTQLPVEFQEPTRVLKYNASDFFRGHIDAHALSGRFSSTRTATFFIYLNDVADGGETHFPLAVPVANVSAGRNFVREGPAGPHCAHLASKETSQQDLMSQYIDGYDLLEGRGAKLQPPVAQRGLSIRPRKGLAILWHSRTPDGQLDPTSQHVGCPVMKVDPKSEKNRFKYSLTTWIHFQPPNFDLLRDTTTDKRGESFLSLAPVGRPRGKARVSSAQLQSGQFDEALLGGWLGQSGEGLLQRRAPGSSAASMPAGGTAAGSTSSLLGSDSDSLLGSDSFAAAERLLESAVGRLKKEQQRERASRTRHGTGVAEEHARLAGSHPEAVHHENMAHLARPTKAMLRAVQRNTTHGARKHNASQAVAGQDHAEHEVGLKHLNHAEHKIGQDHAEHKMGQDHAEHKISRADDRPGPRRAQDQPKSAGRQNASRGTSQRKTPKAHPEHGADRQNATRGAGQNVTSQQVHPVHAAGQQNATHGASQNATSQAANVSVSMPAADRNRTVQLTGLKVAAQARSQLDGMLSVSEDLRAALERDGTELQRELDRRSAATEAARPEVGRAAETAAQTLGNHSRPGAVGLGKANRTAAAVNLTGSVRSGRRHKKKAAGHRGKRRAPHSHRLKAASHLEVPACVDIVPHGAEKWHDADGPQFDCFFYAQGNGTGCKLYGRRFGSFNMTAADACCACGGGRWTGEAGEEKRISTLETENARLRKEIEKLRVQAGLLDEEDLHPVEDPEGINSDDDWDANDMPEWTPCPAWQNSTCAVHLVSSPDAWVGLAQLDVSQEDSQGK